MRIRPLERRDPQELRTTVVVLSAGRESLVQVLQRIVRTRPRPVKVQLIWSGAGPVPSDIPAGVECVSIPPETFDHGGTRQLALDMCQTPLIAFVTDDAEPTNDSWLRSLISPLRDPSVGATYGRQIAHEHASIAEKIFREVRYPSRSSTLSPDEIRSRSAVLPISDANAAYRVEALKAVRGFPKRCASGEDHDVACRLVIEGWSVAYVADASVLHSHDLTWEEILRRGWDVGRLATIHSERKSIPYPGAGRGGMKLAIQMLRHAWGRSGILAVAEVGWVVALRATGYFAARLMCWIDEVFPAETRVPTGN